MNNLVNKFLSCVGATPLVKMGFCDDLGCAQIWCKLEFMNPGGSTKDRMCVAIINSMEADGILRHGDALLEASCGNTAISLAMIAAARGYRLTLVMPETVPVERRRLLAAYGAELVFTSPSNGMKGAMNRASEILDANKRMLTINQFDNPANPTVHRLTTAREIVNDLGKAPDVFVAGVGTGGTITGVGEFLKELAPKTRVVAVEPSDSPVLSGGNPGPNRIPGIGAGFVPKILNADIIDEVEVVDILEAASAARTLAEKEGIFAGLSSGAALHGALHQAEALGPDKVVVTILCDSGERYACFEP